MSKKFTILPKKTPLLYVYLAVLLLLIIVLVVTRNIRNNELAVEGQSGMADDLSSYLDLPPLKDGSNDAWYRNCKFIAHAGGGIDGLVYTNSREAVDHTLSKNVNVIEIDFALSSDDELICYHTMTDVAFDQRYNFTLEEFIHQPVQGKYTSLTVNDIYIYMRNNPEMYVVIDTKDDNYLQIIQRIVNSAGDDILDRFIVQCYFPGDKAKIAQIYNFPESNYIFTAYKYCNSQMKVLKVCMDENINVLALPIDGFIYTPDVIKLYTDKNIVVYFYTINRIDAAEYLFNAGVNGVYTDILYNFTE